MDKKEDKKWKVTIELEKSEDGVQTHCDSEDREKKREQIREMTFIYLFSQWAPLRLRSSFQRRAGQESSNKISQAVCPLGTSP